MAVHLVRMGHPLGLEALDFLLLRDVDFHPSSEGKVLIHPLHWTGMVQVHLQGLASKEPTPRKFLHSAQLDSLMDLLQKSSLANALLE